MLTGDPAATPAPSAEPSPWWLAFRVFDEPGQVFASLARQPRGLIPVLMLIVATLGVTMGIPTRVMQNGIREQFDRMEQKAPGRIPPEIGQKAVADAGKIGGRIQQWAFGTGFLLIFFALTAAVFSLIFNSVSGTEIGFKDEWAIVTHACMPLVIGSAVSVITISMSGDIMFRLGLGFLVSRENSPFLHAFLQLFSIFGMWTATLIAVGNQVKMKAKGVGLSLAIVGGLWAVVNALLAWISTALGGMIA